MSKMVGENGKNFPPAKLAERGEKNNLFFKSAPAKKSVSIWGNSRFSKKIMAGNFGGKKCSLKNGGA